MNDSYDLKEMIKKWKENREKAVKWDAIQWHTSCPHEDADCAISPELENLRDDLRMLMSGLVVEEECQYLTHHSIKENELVPLCPECHGTGAITRGATPEEARELIDWLLLDDSNENERFFAGKFTLKSGAILKMEEGNS